MLKSLILAAFVAVSLCANAQYWYGGSVGNYAGISGVYHNPSWLADSRYKFHINLAGSNVYLTNDYIGLKTPYSPMAAAVKDVGFLNRIFKMDPQYLDENGSPVWDESYMKESINGNKKNVFVQTEVRLPSFQINLDANNAIGLAGRVRGLVQVTDMSEDMARMIRWGFDVNSEGFKNGDLNTDKLYTNNSFSIQALAYQEYGLTYARKIVDLKKHYVKGGLTGKIYLPIYSAYIKNEGVDITVFDTDSVLLDNMNISYGYVHEDAMKDYSPFSTKLGKGFGADIGFTYEYRPRIEDFKYTMDGKEDYDRGKNKYLVRVSGSVNDIGSLTVKNDDYVKAYKLNSNSGFRWGAGTIQALDYYDSIYSGEGAMAAIDQLFRDTIGFESEATSMKYKMPTTLNLNVDFRVIKHFYVNAGYIQTLRKREVEGIRGFSMMAIAPRFESRIFDFGIPFLISNDLKSPKIGFNMRLGPFFLGSDDINAMFKNKESKGLDIYFGVSYGICRKKPKDKDKDGISNKKDDCKNTPGIFELKGCPDTDKDGVADKNDLCPEVAGLAEYNGCPDTDEDRIVDHLDSCPEVAGLAKFNGCPDTDEDGIIDSEDRCPEIAGPVETQGCPDSDGDGILDHEDDCVNEKGPKEFNGCPDTDGDGIIDKNDRCPDVAGPQEFTGCPDTDGDKIPDIDDKCPETPGLAKFKGCPDTDGDGIPDHQDLCPLEKGTVENNGCPAVEEKIELVEITKEEEEVLRTAFSNLEFQTGKAEMQPSSFISLDSLANLMERKPDYRLYVAGHTDNVGNKKLNTKLSLDRANAVKTYLTGKGIDGTRIKTEGFGMDRPIADNKTAEGRQKNRRVEFRIIK